MYAGGGDRVFDRMFWENTAKNIRFCLQAGVSPYVLGKHSVKHTVLLLTSVDSKGNI